MFIVFIKEYIYPFEPLKIVNFNRKCGFLNTELHVLSKTTQNTHSIL